MRYLGGKARIAKKLLPFFLQHAEGRPVYLEPFLGGGNVFAAVAPHFERAVASDIHEDIVLMWRGLLDGSFDPPEHVTREEYLALRDSVPSALRGFVGFGYSFGGKWFGGYAGVSPGHHEVGAARRAVLRQLVGMQGATVVHADYRSWPVHSGCVVYCDPPYQGTTSYRGTEAFDHAEFWETMGTWALAGAAVLVSSYEAPDDWCPVWAAQKQLSVGATGKERVAVERLFAHESLVAARSAAA